MLQLKNISLQTIVYIGNKLSVHGYTPTAIENLSPKLESLGYKVISASSKLGKTLRLLDMLTAIVENRKAGVVLIDTYSTSAFYFAFSCAQLCRLLNIKYIPLLHGGNLPARFASSPSLTKMVFKYSFTNVAVSPYLQSVLQQHSYKNALIENYIDIDRYTFRHRNSVAPKLLWLRSFDKIYNPEMAIHVLNTVRLQYPESTLTMVGPDKDGSMQICKDLTQSLGLNEHVQFTGKLSNKDWTALADKHDIFINTSAVDNLPVSIIETMALGMAIVSTNVGGLAYLIQHNYNGLLSDANDVKQMAVHICQLLSNNAQVTELSTNARATAEKYDWRQIKDKWVNLLSTLHEA